MSSAQLSSFLRCSERKTTGSTFMIGCVVKTKERLHEQRRKEDNWVNLHDRMCGKNQRVYMSSAERKTTGSTFMIGCVVFKTKERLHEQRRKEDNWVNLHDRMCGF